MSAPETTAPAFSFTAHQSTSPFAVPRDTYLAAHAHAGLTSSPYEYIATGALVFNSSTVTATATATTTATTTTTGTTTTTTTTTAPRILLVQRAATDSLPNRWEVPGGGCDATDASILHGAARELWEETGLVALRIGPPVGAGHCFISPSGNRVCRFSFLVEVERDGTAAELDPPVRLDPREHQAYVWAAEEQVAARAVGDLVLDFSTLEQERVVREAFGLWRDWGAEEDVAVASRL